MTQFTVPAAGTVPAVGKLPGQLTQFLPLVQFLPCWQSCCRYCNSCPSDTVHSSCR
jgi:hypothetical protein